MAKRWPTAVRLGIALLVVFVAIDAGVWLWWKSRKEHRYDKQILLAGRKYSLDPALIKAVIWQESRFNPTARGRAGEIGLMQVREDAALEWADAEKIHPFDHEQILDPAKNIQAGSYYLAHVLKRYQGTDNPIPYALADYNAGRTHVLRWNKGAAKTNSTTFLAQVDYPGTRQYALNIMERYEHYRKEIRN